MNRLSAIFVVLLLSSTFVEAAIPSVQQQLFIDQMVPEINKANAAIEKERGRLSQLYQQWHYAHMLTPTQKIWLKQLAKKYKVDPTVGLSQQWQPLFKRVDEIPASLALAQAINESAWGTSRFAIEGNNYFGTWCYQQGCGLVPLQRGKGQTHEVKVFASMAASVNHYANSLNTNSAYQRFRDLRIQQQEQGLSEVGSVLSAGLAKYSQKGQAYVNIINQIINAYDLKQYD